MRTFIFFIFFSAATGLSAQNVLPIGKGWQVSFGLEGSVTSKKGVSNRLSVIAADTLSPAPFSTEERFGRQTGEVDIGNGPVTYYTESGYGFNRRFENALFQLLANVQLHYRTAGNIEFSAGLAYSSYTVNRPFAAQQELPESFMVVRNERDVRRGGLRLNSVYNLFSRRRLQPYVGLETDFFISRSNYLRTIRQFPNLGISQDLGATVIERFRVNTLLDFDLNFLAGVNYRLSEKVAAGLALRLPSSDVVVSGMVQVRYLFGPKPVE